VIYINIIIYSSHTAANISKLVLDPLEAVSDTSFKLSLHSEDVVGLDSLLPLELWIVCCTKPSSLLEWPVEIVGVWSFCEPKFIVGAWVIFLHDPTKATTTISEALGFERMHETGNVCVKWGWMAR